MRVAILKAMDEVGFGCRRDGNELIAGGFFQMSDKDFAGIQRVRVEAWRGSQSEDQRIFNVTQRGSRSGCERRNRRRDGCNNRRWRSGRRRTDFSIHNQILQPEATKAVFSSVF